MHILPLLRAGHLPPTVAVTSITTALSLSVGRGSGAIAVAAAVGAGQLAVGWTNDYIDRDRDRVAGRIDKPIVMQQVRAETVRRAAVVAAMACVPLSMLSGWRAGLAHVVAVSIALAYDLRLKATLLSPIPYLVAFGILPAFVTLGLRGHPWPPWWAMTAAAVLGCGAHFINTIGDSDDDRANGVVGLPQLCGPRRSVVIGAALLMAAVVTLTFAPPGPPATGAAAGLVVATALVLGVFVTSWRGLSRVAWPLTIATAVTAVALLIANGSSLT